MTSTPSKDRAEERMDAAREVVRVLNVVSDRYADSKEAECIRARYEELKSKFSFSEANEISRAEFVAAALDKAFAEGMKRAAEIVRKDGSKRGLDVANFADDVIAELIAEIGEA